MQNDYYILAHEQASKDRAELRVEIEKLLATDAKLERLVECLKELLPETSPAEVHAQDGREHHGG